MFKHLRPSMSCLIAISVALTTPAPLMAQIGPAPATLAPPDFNLKALQERDPLFKEFAETPFLPPKYGPFEVNDPMLDQDPYFMRSQQYRPVFEHPATDGTAYSVSRDGIAVHVPGTHQALFIAQKLAPLFEIENFVFFQATDKALFTDKAKSDADQGEGLFFLDKRYVQTELSKAQDQRPVPIFFLPLDGTGWTQAIQAISVEPLPVLAFRNAAGVSATIELGQVYRLAKLLNNTLVLTTVQALKQNLALTAQLQAQFLNKNGGGLELPFILPPRGSTAAFGTFATGLDLDHPERALFGIKNASNFNFDLSFFPKAHANMDPDMLDRLIWIGYITGTTYTAGLIAQYSVLRKRMLERRAYIEASEDEIAKASGKPTKNRTGVLFRIGRELRESVDVFGHGLATVSSGIGVTNGFLTEYLADRFGGRQGSSPNGLIRRFLEFTVLYGRKQNEFIGTNLKAFYLGVLILGGIDTASVAVQLLYVSPLFFPWVAQPFGHAIAGQMAQQFSASNAVNNNVLTSEVMRNFSGYFISGSYQYSSSQRNALLEIVRPEVERQLSQEGKDLTNPAVQTEANKRIESRLESMLVERGLPSRKEFLFSGPSVIRGFAKAMGFKVDRSLLEQSADGQSEKEARLKAGGFVPGGETNSFVLEKARYGLVTHALKQAIQSLMDTQGESTDNGQVAGAIEFLKDVKNKYSFIERLFKNSLTDPKQNPLRNPAFLKEAIEDAKQIRKMITMWSYDGDVMDEGVKFLDIGDIAKQRPDVALLAVKTWRQAFFSLVQDKPVLLRPSEDDLKKYLPEAKAQADEFIKTQSPDLEFNEVDRDITALEIVKKRVIAEAKQQKIQNWEPPKQDFLERLERQRAHNAALIYVHEQLNGTSLENPNVEAALASGNTAWINSLEAMSTGGKKPAELEAMLLNDARAVPLYKEAYRKALSKGLGLYALPDEDSELVRKVKELAENDVQESIESNPEWKAYFSKLDELSKLRFLAHQYANGFLGHYTELTVSNTSVVGLTSHEQPGVFQRLRQTKFVTSNTWFGKTVKTVLRALESPMDNTAYHPGLQNWLRRNVPWYQDGKTDVMLTWRIMWTYLTIGYLTQYYIWQVKFPWTTAAFFLFASGLTTVVHYWLDRLMMNVGMPAMKNTWSKVVYSVFYSWLTYPTYLPFFLFYRGFDSLAHQYAIDPLTKAATAVVGVGAEGLETLNKACEMLLQVVK